MAGSGRWRLSEKTTPALLLTAALQFEPHQFAIDIERGRALDVALAAFGDDLFCRGAICPEADEPGRGKKPAKSGCAPCARPASYCGR
jgi:hypothetical protein